MCRGTAPALHLAAPASHASCAGPEPPCPAAHSTWQRAYPLGVEHERRQVGLAVEIEVGHDAVRALGPAARWPMFGAEAYAQGPLQIRRVPQRPQSDAVVCAELAGGRALLCWPLHINIMAVAHPHNSYAKQEADGVVPAQVGPGKAGRGCPFPIAIHPVRRELLRVEDRQEHHPVAPHPH